MGKQRQFLFFLAAWTVLLAAFALVAFWADSRAVSYHETLFNKQQKLQVTLATRAIDQHINGLTRHIRGDIRTVRGARTNDTASRYTNDTLADRLSHYSEEIAAVATVVDGQHTLVWQRAGWSSDVSMSRILTDYATADTEFAVNDVRWLPDFVLSPDHQFAALAASAGYNPAQQQSSWVLVLVDLGMLFERYIAPMRHGVYGAGYVLDGQGRIAYDHETQIIGRSVFDGMHDKYPALVKLDRRMMAEDTGTGEYVFTVERGGAESRKLIAWDSVPFGAQKFVIALSKPDIEINAALNAQRRTLTIAAILLLVGFTGTTVVFFRMRQKLLIETNEMLSETVNRRTRELDRELKARMASEERILDFAEVSSDWFWETDEELRFTFFSDLPARLSHVDPSDWVGRRRDELTTDDLDAEKWHRHIAAMHDRKEIRDFRYEMKQEGEDRLIVSVSGKPIFDADGKFIGYRGTATDITEQVEAQDALAEALCNAEQANRAKSEFLATMSHELRTPLNAIIGFSDILTNRYFGDSKAAKYREYASDIHDSAQHLLDLVNDLLDLSAIEAGKANISHETVSVAAIAQHCAEVVAEKLRSKGLSLESDIDPTLPTVETDPRALKQVILNLLSNSVKFTPRGGTVSLSARKAEDSIQITVGDTGEGIPADRLEKITEPFVRAGDDPYTFQEGWGLGLSIVKSLISLHEWSLSIESAVGVGTAVTIRLPLYGVSNDEEVGVQASK